MTHEELKRLRELCERATPGPWITFDNGAWGGQGAGIAIGENPDHWVVFGKITEEPHISNSFLCAAARDAIPKLLDIVEKVEPALKAGLEKVQLYEELATKACKEANELREERDSLKSEVESLKQEVNGLSENLYISNEAAVNAERERDSLKAELKNIDAHVWNKAYLDLRVECDSLKAENMNLSEAHEAAQHYKKECDSLKAEVESVRYDNYVLSEVRDAITVEGNKAIKERDRALARVEKLEYALKYLDNNWDFPSEAQRAITRALAQGDKEAE